MMRIVVVCCATFAIYLLLAGQVSRHELATGIVLASLATAWASAIRGTSQWQFGFSSELLRPLGRGVAQLFSASIATGDVLVRVAIFGNGAGAAHEDGFSYGPRGGTGGRSVERTRRAFAVLLASWAPDRFVMNLDSRSDTALIHAIVPHKQEPDPQWLI